MSEWSVQEAMNRFNEVVEKAESQGPQLIRNHGKTAVLVSLKDYEALIAHRGSLADFFRSASVELDLTRESDSGKEIQF